MVTCRPVFYFVNMEEKDLGDIAMCGGHECEEDQGRRLSKD